MSSEWQTVLLGDVAELSGGYAFKSEEYTESGHFVLRTVNITDDGRIDRRGATFVSLEAARKYERFALKPFDTLFVMVGATLGKTGFVKTQDLPALLNQNMWLIRAKPSLISPLYLHYAFKVFSQPLLGMASGSARGFVKRDDFRQMIIPLPSAPEQVRISSLLGALDDRITLLRETNATLEAIAQALFKSWFVDFDPVRAKQEGRAPEGMSDATAALFPDGFEESELGLVPRGWRVAQFADFIERQSVGKKYDQKSAKTAGSVPILDQGKSGIIGFHDDKPGVTASLDEPVVVFANHTCYMRLITFPFSVIQNVLPFKGKGVDTVWAYYATQGRVKFSEYKGHWPDFAIEKAPLPDEQLTVKFREVVDPLMRRIQANDEQAKNLAEVRDTLLPRLISGQLRLPEAEAQLEGALA